MRNQDVRPFAEQGHFTGFHNLTLDYIMPRVSGSAWKILSLIIRNTVGWGKKSDAIAYSQIQEGTGIRSDATVSKGLAALLEMGCILKREGAGQFDANCYALNRNFTVPASENEVVTASKNEERNRSAASKNEAMPASKNEVVTASKNEDTKESKTTKQVLTVVAEEERASADVFAAASAASFELVICSEPTESNALIEAIAQVVGLPPLAQLSDHQRAQLPAAAAFVLEQVQGDIDEAARQVLARYSAPTWSLPNPPQLKQFRAAEWHRAGAKIQNAAQMEAAQNGTHRNGQSRVAAQHAAADQFIAECGQMADELRAGTGSQSGECGRLGDAEILWDRPARVGASLSQPQRNHPQRPQRNR